jgi:ribonucleoside-diphosphate reductase alpha chain
VYRNGSRSGQPLEVGQKEEAAPVIDNIIPINDYKRPKKLPGYTEQISTGCGTVFITVNYKDGEVYECFLKSGGSGGCAAFTEALGRVISIARRHGVPLEVLIDQVTSVRCDNFSRQVGRNPCLKGKSCPDVIGRILREASVDPDFTGAITYSNIEPYIAVAIEEDIAIVDECPVCKEPIEHGGACVNCRHCGWGKC